MRFIMWLAAVAGIGISSPSLAGSIDTTIGGSPNDIGDFGIPDTSAYGQTFVAQAGGLNSFSMALDTGDSPSSLNFTGNVYAWNGTGATGPALYTSAVQTYSGTGAQTFNFNTASLSLTPGQQYVAFLTTDGVLNSGSPTASMPLEGDTYISGGFVYQNNNGDAPALATQSWTTYGSDDAAFTASFGAASAAPEPATWAMMILGLGLVGGVMYRQQRKSEDRFTSRVRVLAAA